MVKDKTLLGFLILAKTHTTFNFKTLRIERADLKFNKLSKLIHFNKTKLFEMQNKITIKTYHEVIIKMLIEI